ERVVEEPESECSRELQRDGRAPPLLDRQRAPPGAQLVPEADLLRDLAARADVRLELAHLTAFWCAFTEESFGPEDEDEDEDREDDRLGPVGAGSVPAEPLVEGLDAADHERAENRTGQIADPAEHGGRERDESELEPLEVSEIRDVQGIDDTGGAGQSAGDQERERDRAVDVDAHDRGG